MLPLMKDHTRNRSTSILRKHYLRKRGTIKPLNASLSFTFEKLDSNVQPTSTPRAKLRNEYEEYNKLLNLLSAKISKFLTSKCNRYKEMYAKIGEFFKREVTEINRLSSEWFRKIETVKEIASQMEFNAIQITPARLIREGESLKNQEESNVLVQRLEYEIGILKHYANKMTDYENKRDDFISEKIDDLLSNKFSDFDDPKQGPNAMEEKNINAEPIIEKVLVKPEKPSILSTKYDIVTPNEFYLLDIMRNTKQRLSFTNFKLPPNCASLFIQGRYFVCGGRSDDNEKTKSEFRIMCEYDFNNNEFNQKAPMVEKRRNHSIIGIEDIGEFYCIGGYNKRYGYLNSCEKYNIENNQWKRVGDMNDSKQDPSVCLVNNKYIYIIGGALHNKEEWIYLDTLERLDIQNDMNNCERILYKFDTSWSSRAFMGTIPLNNDNILIFGGYNGKMLDEYFVYSISENYLKETSKKLPKGSTFVCRNSGVLLFNNNIFAISGNNFDVFKYDLEKDEWEIPNIPWTIT